MIILLTGPTGTGKTDTSWALLEQFEQMIFLDCDWFASRTPFSWKEKGDVESVYQALSIMLDFYIKKGNKNFVIPLTYEMAILFKNFKHYFLKDSLTIIGFRLRCSENELERRIRQRDRVENQKQQELQSIMLAQNNFDSHFPDNSIFHLIDTSDLNESEVSHKIISLIKKQ